MLRILRLQKHSDFKLYIFFLLISAIIAPRLVAMVGGDDFYPVEVEPEEEDKMPPISPQGKNPKKSEKIHSRSKKLHSSDARLVYIDINPFWDWANEPFYASYSQEEKVLRYKGRYFDDQSDVQALCEHFTGKENVKNEKLEYKTLADLGRDISGFFDFFKKKTLYHISSDKKISKVRVAFPKVKILAYVECRLTTEQEKLNVVKFKSVQRLKNAGYGNAENGNKVESELQYRIVKFLVDKKAKDQSSVSKFLSLDGIEGIKEWWQYDAIKIILDHGYSFDLRTIANIKSAWTVSAVKDYCETGYVVSDNGENEKIIPWRGMLNINSEDRYKKFSRAVQNREPIIWKNYL